MTSFGYFLSGEELGPRRIVDVAKAAEQAGFERVWVSDHFHPWLTAQAESPFIWSVLAAITESTNLDFTTAVTCPILRVHPAIIAQATATTAVLAGDRFRFGIGTGERLNEHILGQHWPPVAVRLEMLEEAVEIIRALWTGDTLSHRGDHYTVETATIFSAPDTPPPILMSGFGPKATDVAAEIADGFIAVESDSELLDRYRAAGGKGPSQAGTKVSWAPTEAEGIENARRTWGHTAFGGPASQELAVPEHYDPLAEAATDDQIREAVPCGPDAEQAAESIRAYVEAGFDEIYVAQMGPQQEEGIRFLADEVLPLV